MKKGVVREMREPLSAELPDKLEVLVLEDANWRISAWQEGEVVDTGFRGSGQTETYKRLKVKSRHVRIEKLDDAGNVLKKEERGVKRFYKSWLISAIEDCQIEGASNLIQRDSYISEHEGKKYEFKQTKVLGKLFRRHRKEFVSRKQERYTASSIYNEYYLPAYPTSKLCPESLFEDLGLDPEKGYTRKQILKAGKQANPWKVLNTLDTWTLIFNSKPTQAGHG